MDENYPKISIITPNFNGASYLEETILSVLNQDYPNLEYIIIDGGSTDESVEIIKKYADQLHYWESKPDKGQSHAINKGLKKATGDWVAFLNSDDVYVEGALKTISDTILTHTSTEWICGGIQFFSQTEIYNTKFAEFDSKTSLQDWLTYKASTPQPGSFWKRSLLDAIGYFNENLQFTFDSEYWIRLFLQKTSYISIPSIIAQFRLHESSKTIQSRVPFLKERYTFIDLFDDYLNTSEKLRIRKELDLLYAESLIKNAIKNNSLSLLVSSVRINPQIIRKRFFWGALKLVLNPTKA